MKHWVWLFALFACETFAGVSINLNEVRFVDLVRVVYSDIYPRSFVIDQNAVRVDDPVSLHLRNVDPAAVAREVSRLASSLGLDVREVDGVVRVVKAGDDREEKDTLVYRPRYRSVPYLLDLVSSFFPRDGFSGQRQVQQQGGAQQQAGQGQLQSPPIGGQRGSMQSGQAQQETGTNAYGMISRNEADVIVFNGSDRDRRRLGGLLASLDTPAGELLIKAVVYEVRTAAKEGNALKLATSILSGKVGVTLDQGSKDQASLKVSFGGIDAVLSALSNDSRFKLVSSPQMRVKSGGSARFVAGSDVPVLGNVTYQQTGSAVQSVDYKTSGVILDIRPSVRESINELQISQQISSFVPTTTGVNNTPTLLKRELHTQVSSKDGELVMIGGLDESANTDEGQGLSFLPRWLRSTSSDNSRTEIMVVIDAQRI